MNGNERKQQPVIDTEEEDDDDGNKQNQQAAVAEEEELHGNIFAYINNNSTETNMIETNYINTFKLELLLLCRLTVEKEEPVRFSKHRQSSAVDCLHHQTFCVTTRMITIMLHV